MIKAVLLGLWSCVIAIGAAYLGLLWSLEGASGKSTAGAKPPKMAHVRVKPVSVPVTADGQVRGYVVGQFSYTARADDLKVLEVKPEVFLYDALFNAIFTRQKLDITSIDKASWAEFSKHIKDAVNSRLGGPVVQDFITEELGYVPFELSRGRSGPLPNGRLKQESDRRTGKL